MINRIQPKTYRRSLACLGVWFLMSTGLLLANPQTPPTDTCQTPDPPLLNSSAASVCRGESVTLTATGCAGTTIWSTGETGLRISIRPQKTVRYTAVCRSAQGCVSCFAEPARITVRTPDAPTVTASAPVVCPGESVTLTAVTKAGTVRWSDATTGFTRVVAPRQTTAYQATGEVDGCAGNPSVPITVQAGIPQIPTVSADKQTVCTGQSVRLTASGCLGRVRWSDGEEGITRQLDPQHTISFKAVCLVGNCRSDSSTAVRVVVTPSPETLNLLTSVSNGCPFQTADLTQAITTSPTDQRVRYEFKTSPDPYSAAVQTATAVPGGTYYIVARSASGCYSQPARVSVTIMACANAIAACLSSPAIATIQLDSLDRTNGIVRLRGQLHGSATSGHWQTSGTGLLTNTTNRVRYVASETDLQRGRVTFTFATDDPDGDGPCLASAASLSVLVAPPAVDGENGNPVPGTPVAAEPSEPLPVAESPETTTVFIPEGFSPNNDGVNDRFVIRQTGQPLAVSLSVFNRWGQLVYQSDVYKNDWDGTANRGIRTGTSGQGLPDGTYFYSARLSDGREFTRFLTLAR